MKYREIINVHRQFMWRIRNVKNDEMNEILISCKTHIKFAFIAGKLAIATIQFCAKATFKTVHNNTNHSSELTESNVIKILISLR